MSRHFVILDPIPIFPSTWCPLSPHAPSPFSIRANVFYTLGARHRELDQNSHIRP